MDNIVDQLEKGVLFGPSVGPIEVPPDLLTVAEMHYSETRALVREAAREGILLWAENGQLRYRSQKGNIPDALRSRLQSRKSDLIGELSLPVFKKRASAAKVIQYPPYSIDFWMENQGSPSLRHSLHFAIRLFGDVSLQQVLSALNRLTARYDVLRSRVNLQDGVLSFIVDPAQMLSPTDVVDISERSFSDAERSAHLESLIQRAIYAPFGDKVHREQVIKVSDREYAIAVVVHHFVADAVSLDIITSELATALCDNPSSELVSDTAPLQYSDYLLGMNEWLMGEGPAYRLKYWRAKMAGAPPVHFPRTDETPILGTTHLDIVPVQAGAPLRARIADAAAAARVPIVAVLLTASFVALARTLRREDLVIIIVHFGRNHPALLQLVGFTANCFPVRVTVRPGISYSELVCNVNDAYNIGNGYQIPWGLLMRSLGELDMSCVAPIFNYWPPAPQPGRNRSSGSPEAGAVEISRIPVERPPDTNSVDWKSHIINVIDSGADLIVNVKYEPAKYQATAVHEFADAFIRCIEVMAEDPTRPVGAGAR
jgi:condensation domain-containing protein/tubulysin polyketide synthase-like protein